MFPFTCCPNSDKKYLDHLIKIYFSGSTRCVEFGKCMKLIEGNLNFAYYPVGKNRYTTNY